MIRLGGVVVSLVAALAASADGASLVVGAFSQAPVGGPLPAEWKPLTFGRIDRHTEYSLVAGPAGSVVRADSTGAASGLTREVEVDLSAHPILEWSWRIANVLERGDVSKRSGDDYPARVYVTFAYDPERADFVERARYEAARLLYGNYPPKAALNYIWASRAELGSIVPNPYTDRNQMIVVRSGAGRVEEWLSERRNVAADYREAFGEEPPRVSGVAIMTDTDDTNESAVAWFGDIVFRSEIAD